jgi:GDP-mannose pyrophosphatase NudK
MFMNNPNVKINEVSLLSDNWYKLNKVTFDIKQKNGHWQTQSRECYDRGNGAVILLYNAAQGTVVLTSQFRMPTYMNGNATGMLIEACAGLLDQDSPEECIRRETAEETGYLIGTPQKLFELYMSPGSVTEIVHFFIAEYSNESKSGNGGGIEEEQEDIDVLEIPFEQAMEMVRRGEIKDAKTIILLQHLRLNQLM